jgi:hypothetical protein
VSEEFFMTDQTSTGPASFPVTAMPPGMLMWAGMYAVLFTIAGGMIAYLYNRD